MVEKSRRTGKREIRYYTIARVQVNNNETLKWDSGKEGADNRPYLVSGWM